ncbi:MAG: hypothetical protein LBO72_03610 [Helicobacteraceae bacterium]|jgi:flagellar assembly protein FliH|nr:hypothetical protein [Helicobacteraceae bacterium]
MEIIISPDRLEAHRIVKYEFKNFDESIASVKESAPPRRAAPVMNATLESGFVGEAKNTLEDIRAKQLAENDLVVNLVKKVEGFADNVAKLQIRLEKQESDFAERLESEKNRSYDDGKRAGELEATNRLLGEVETKKAQLVESIVKLDTALKEFADHAVSIEKELTSVAVEIANEVLTIEIGENSAKIAASLAASLLSGIKEALKISIKVNPADLAAVGEALKDDARIEIAPDRAVAAGGVIIRSDAGNIDAQLHSRFMAIKKSILEGGSG